MPLLACWAFDCQLPASSADSDLALRQSELTRLSKGSEGKEGLRLEPSGWAGELALSGVKVPMSALS